MKSMCKIAKHIPKSRSNCERIGLIGMFIAAGLNRYVVSYQIYNRNIDKNC